MKLRIGFSPCPNDTFLFDALVHSRVQDPELEFEVVLGDVEELNQLALRGELDVTKLSYAAFSLVMDQYALLRSGSALGRGCGPLLVAAQPALQSNPSEWTVAIPGLHTTANFLLGWAYPDITIKYPMLFSDIEQAVLNNQVNAGLLIHENSFTYASKGLFKLADLGEIWESKTGLPIPLGGIAAKRSLGQHTIQRVERLIRESVQHAFRHPHDSRDYVQAHAQEMEPAVQQAHIDLYVNSFTEDLGTDGEQAVRELLRVNGIQHGSLFAE